MAPHTSSLHLLPGHSRGLHAANRAFHAARVPNQQHLSGRNARARLQARRRKRPPPLDAAAGHAVVHTRGCVQGQGSRVGDFTGALSSRTTTVDSVNAWLTAARTTARVSWAIRSGSHTVTCARHWAQRSAPAATNALPDPIHCAISPPHCTRTRTRQARLLRPRGRRLRSSTEGANGHGQRWIRSRTAPVSSMIAGSGCGSVQAEHAAIPMSSIASEISSRARRRRVRTASRGVS